MRQYDIEFFTNKKSKTDSEISKKMLTEAIAFFESLDSWTMDSIHDGLIALAEKLEVKNATLMWPVRIGASGRLVTPGGAVEICYILGKDETISRLNSALKLLNRG